MKRLSVYLATMVAAVALAVLLAQTGCGTPCGPSTCAGCCAADGTCKGGITSDTCGSQGKACTACVAGQVCSAGTCFFTNPGNGNDSGSTDSGTSPDSGQGQGGIPAAGTSDAVDQNWGSVEPNDTPAQATPLGTNIGGNIYAWVNGNTIGGGDPTDYFVFQTGPDAGMLSFDICYSPPITSMNASLWVVVNGVQQLPPVATYTGNAQCVSDLTMLTPIQANTEYLIGLFAQTTGDGGMYLA